MRRLLDLTSSCKQWIVEKAIAQDSTALNLCSLFDRESKDTASGERTLHSSVTLPDSTMGRTNKRPKTKTDDAAKVVEKGSKKKKDEVDSQTKKSSKVTQSTEKKGKGSLGGKKVPLPAKSVTSDTEDETDEDSSDDEEEAHDGKKKNDDESDDDDEKGSESLQCS